ncbi:MAG: zf-HC2 domain-containing protein [Lachnospiraceae bacterium]|jgi:hypothetical protein
MDCKQAISEIRPFLEGTMSYAEEEDFLKHIRSCASCREELEIYFTVEKAVENLDADTGARSFNLRREYEKELERREAEVRRHNLVSQIRQMILIAAFSGIALSAAVLFRFLYF